MVGAAGQSVRLFSLIHGGHWTLFGYGLTRQMSTVKTRRGLHIHFIGTKDECGTELSDAHSHFLNAYQVERTTWVLIRPDGYIGAMVSDENVDSLSEYFEKVGV